MEDPKEIILKTEYSNRFDEVRKNLVVQSYFKYGKASRNFVSGYVDAIGSLKKCIQTFEETDICIRREKNILCIRIPMSLPESMVCQ